MEPLTTVQTYNRGWLQIPDYLQLGIREFNEAGGIYMQVNLELSKRPGNPPEFRGIFCCKSPPTLP